MALKKKQLQHTPSLNRLLRKTVFEYRKGRSPFVIPDYIIIYNLVLI